MLSDAKKRDIYDRGGEKAIKEGGTGGGENFASPMDIFDFVFGGGSRMHRERKGMHILEKWTLNFYIYNLSIICIFFVSQFEALINIFLF